MKRLVSFLALVLIAAAGSAAPVITSVTPNSGPVSGGTAVTIKGSGFSTCIICSPPVPPDVLFGSTRAATIQLVDSTTLLVTTPPQFAGTVDVTVSQFDGSTTASRAFTFTGQTAEALEMVLLPIYSPPVHGAFGSEFHTIALAANKGETPIAFYGVDTTCRLIDPPQQPSAPITLAPDAEISLPSECSNWPARFFYVPKSMADSLTFNERVVDVSRTALSSGTEIPIVRGERFTRSRIALLGVPIGGNFRNTLRIYAERAASVRVMVGGVLHIVQLQAGASMFEPAYGTLSDFPVPIDPGSPTTVRVTIDAPMVVVGPTALIEPIWAFVTSTNNTTQQITTITPD